MLQNFNDENFFTEVQEAKKPLLVIFWGQGCYPCKMTIPEMEKLAEKHGQELIVGEVNTDENFNLARQFQIQVVPTLIMFKDGEPLAMSAGYQDVDGLIETFGPYFLQAE